MDTNFVDNTLFNLMQQHGYVGNDKPTLRDCEQFINSKDKNFILNFEYNEKMDAWQFVVRNLATGYHYIQPLMPSMDLLTSQKWGLEHILRRL